MPSKDDIGASTAGGAAVSFIISQIHQSEINDILGKPVEKFTKIWYNELDKSEFAEMNDQED